MVRYPFLALSLTQAHLCDTPFCNVSRDNCSIPHKKHTKNVLRYLSLQSLRPPTCQMPDIENSRKTAEKGAEWVTVKQPKNSWKKRPKHPKNSQNSCFSGVSAVFPAVFRLVLLRPARRPFRLFFGCFQCRAFGTSVGGRRECNTIATSIARYEKYRCWASKLKMWFRERRGLLQGLIS